jgi:hypothetical protein
MTAQITSTKPITFREGDIVTLTGPLVLKGISVTVPAQEAGVVDDVDPEDETKLIVKLLRPIAGLETWKNMICATSSDAHLIVRAL